MLKSSIILVRFRFIYLFIYLFIYYCQPEGFQSFQGKSPGNEAGASWELGTSFFGCCPDNVPPDVAAIFEAAEKSFGRFIKLMIADF